jgi:hypothetical protein
MRKSLKASLGVLWRSKKAQSHGGLRVGFPHERIYHVHIRKTGGTSLNHMFLSLAGDEPQRLYKRLVDDPAHCISVGGVTYVGWNPVLISQRGYFYAFSHIPFHELTLPPRTFTFTCFRDPVRRVLSHYQMLLAYQVGGIDHPCMKTEGPWLGTNFDDFLRRIPEEHLLNQLHMFSQALDVKEACRAALGLDCCIFNDDFNAGVDRINALTGLRLVPLHARKQSPIEDIPERSIRDLRERLAPEYLLIEMLKSGSSHLHR